MSKPIYPDSPTNVPAGITTASASYKRQATLAMLGLAVFMLLFVALAACFIYIGITSFHANAQLQDLIVGAISSVLALFMVKSLFAIRKTADPQGIEVNEQNQPKLFGFLNQLADEVGAPRPHRVFLTPQVNAAVFYDLSLINLFFPSKKNLIVGMGLVNSLNLGELKAVLAHEFGHFSQGSMLVGRWVYITQQIIVHMVATRDWLDKAINFVARFDIRIAWVGWILNIVIWSIRSVVDTLFNVIIIAERALSREMEFNADLVAVSVTGSDALVNALHKLQAADQAWQTATQTVVEEIHNKMQVEDVFETQTAAMEKIGFILGDENFGKSPTLPASEKEKFRLFDEDSARPPQMWATHPANRDREDNAKAHYIEATVDARSAWEVFDDPASVKYNFNVQFFYAQTEENLDLVDPQNAIEGRFRQPWFSPEYKGVYLSRSWVRDFASVNEIVNSTLIEADAKSSLTKVYPNSIKGELEKARNLEIEKATLEGLASGDLKPSGGIIRHRGEELSKSDIPDAIDAISKEYKAIAKGLSEHDALCRSTYLQVARELGGNWEAFLEGLIKLSHMIDHLQAHVHNELALLGNTWAVITADGRIGYFEKKRIVKVCKQVDSKMKEVTQALGSAELTPSMLAHFQVDSWKSISPKFELTEVTKGNWHEWAPAAHEEMTNILNALSIISERALAELITTEKMLQKHLVNGTVPDDAGQPAQVPTEYPLLPTGSEHVLQRKLDLWNRFQLAHGIVPTIARLLVSVGIVGGTIVFGLS